MRIEKNTFLGVIIILLVIGVGFFVFAQESVGANGNSVFSVKNENAQIVKLHVEGRQYVFEPNSVKKGTPVIIEADISRMPGCSKSIVMSGFNIRKVVNENDNFIEFIPNKAGTFNIACSMNMYKGELNVLESDGTKSAYAEKLSASRATCGSNGGGCGCGR